MAGIHFEATLGNSQFIEKANATIDSIHKIAQAAEKAGIDIETAFKKINAGQGISLGSKELESQVNAIVGMFERIASASGVSADAIESAKQKFTSSLTEIANSTDDTATKQEKLKEAVNAFTEDLTSSAEKIDSVSQNVSKLGENLDKAADGVVKTNTLEEKLDGVAEKTEKVGDAADGIKDKLTFDEVSEKYALLIENVDKYANAMGISAEEAARAKETYVSALTEIANSTDDAATKQQRMVDAWYAAKQQMLDSAGIAEQVNESTTNAANGVDKLGDSLDNLADKEPIGEKLDAEKITEGTEEITSRVDEIESELDNYKDHFDSVVEEITKKVTNKSKETADSLNQVKDGINGVADAENDANLNSSFIESKKANADLLIAKYEELKETLQEKQDVINKLHQEGTASIEEQIKAVKDYQKAAEDAAEAAKNAINAQQEYLDAVNDAISNKESEIASEEDTENVEKTCQALEKLKDGASSGEVAMAALKDGLDSAVEAGKAAAASLEGVSTSAKVATVATKAFKAALASIGIGLLLALVSALITKLYELAEAFFSESEAEAKAREELEAQEKMYSTTYSNALSKTIQKYKELQAEYANLRDEHEKIEWIIDNKNQINQLGAAINSVADAESFFKQETESVVKSFMLRAQAAAYAAKAELMYKQAMTAEAGQEISMEDFQKYGLSNTHQKTNEKTWKNLWGLFGGGEIILNEEGADFLNNKKMEEVNDKAQKLLKKSAELEEESKKTLTLSAENHKTKKRQLQDQRANIQFQIDNLDLETEAGKKQLKTLSQQAEEVDKKLKLYNTSKSKSDANKAAREAAKKAKEQEKQNANAIQREIKFNDDLRKIQDEANDARTRANIAAIQDDAERERAAREYQHKKTLADIEKQKDEVYKKIYQDRKADYENKNKDKKYENTDEGKLGWEGLKYKSIKNVQDVEKEILKELGKDEIMKALQEQFGQGNVDVLARPLIDAAELVKKGWKDAGDGIATVFTTQTAVIDANGNERQLLVTPILPDGTILSEKQLKDYLDKNLEGANDLLAADEKGIVIAVDVPIPDGNDPLTNLGEALHQLQAELYDIPKDKIDEIQRLYDILEKAKKVNKFSINEQAQIQVSNELAKARTDLENTTYTNADKQRWENIVKEYQSYTDQKIAIDKQYQEKLDEINRAINEAEKAGQQETVEALKRSRDELFNRTLQQKSQLAMNKLQESPMFSLAFGDLSNVSNDALNYLLENFEKFKNEFSKDPKAMKEWVNKIEAMTDEIANRNPFKALKDADTEYAEAIKNGKAAKARVEQLKQEKKNLEEEKKLLETQISYAEAKIEIDKANGVDTSEREVALANAKDKLAKITQELTDNEIELGKEEEKLGKAENDRTKALNKQQKATDAIWKSIEKLSSSFRGLGNVIGGSAREVMNVISDVADFVGTVHESIEEIKEIDRKLTNAFDSTTEAVKGASDATKTVDKAVEGVNKSVEGTGRAAEVTAQITSKSISTIEKASVILTVISAALQVAMAIADLFGESEEEKKERKDRIKMVDDMANAVANYRIEVLKAKQAEEEWFSTTDLQGLVNQWQASTQALEEYKKRYVTFFENYAKSVTSEGGNLFYIAPILNAMKQLDHFDVLIKNEMGNIESLAEFAKRVYGEELYGPDGILNVALAEDLLNNYGDRILGNGEEVIKGLKNLAEEYKKWQEELESYISDLYSSFADDLTDSLWDAAENGTDAMKSFENSARSSIQAVGKEMVKSLINVMLFEELKKKLQEIYTEYAKMMAAANGDTNKIEEALNYLRTGVSGALNDFKDTTAQTLPTLQSITNDIYNTIDGIFPSSEVLGSHIDAIKSAFQSLLDDPTQNIEQWGRNFRNALIKELVQNTLLGEQYQEWAKKWNKEYADLYTKFVDGEIDEETYKKGLDALMSDFNNTADDITKRSEQMMKELGYQFSAEELNSPFSGLRDTFLDTLTDMEGDAEDFRKRLEEIMVKDLIEKQVLDAEFTINGMTFDNFDAYVGDWNKRYVDAVKSGNQEAVDALIEELMQARELTVQAAEELRERLKKATDDDTFKNMSDSFVSALMDMNKTAEDWAQDIGKTMAEKIIKEMVVPTLIQPLLDDLQKVFNGVMDKAVTVGENGEKHYDWQSVIGSEELMAEIQKITEQYPQLQAVINQILQAFGVENYKYSGFSNLGDSILASLADSSDSIIAWASDMGNRMAQQMAQAYMDSTYGERINELNKQWQQALQDGNQEAMASIQESLEALYKAIGDDETLQSLINKFKTLDNPFKDMANTFVSSLMDMESSAEDFANNIARTLTEQMINKVITDGYQSQIDMLGEKWREALESGDASAIERIKQQLAELYEQMGDAVKPLLDAISDINKKTDTTFSSMTDSWVSALMDMEGTAEEFAESVGKTMAQKIISEMIAPVYIQPILDAMQNAYNAAVKVQGATVTSVVQTMLPYIEQIKGIYSEIQPMISDLFGQIGITATETAEDIEEIQYALQDMKSNFVSTLMDMKSTTQDFSQDISKILAQSFIEKFLLGDAFDARMKQWQEQYESILGSGMSEDERKKQLRALRDSIASAKDDYTKQAIAIQELLGITTEDAQQATMNMADKITYDQADQLLGVNIAQELLLEQILAVMLGTDSTSTEDLVGNIGEKVNIPIGELEKNLVYKDGELFDRVANSNAMQSEMVMASMQALSNVTQVGQDNILLQIALANSHLELIRDYSKNIRDEVLMHLGSIDSKLTHLREL